MGRFTPNNDTANGKPPIKEILEHYGATLVPERVRGWAAMRCPFHNDSSASASVNTSEQLFRCHTCDIGGDTYSIVQQREHTTDFPHTVAETERILGYSVDRIRGSTKQGRKRPRLFDQPTEPVSGQTSIFQSRFRR